MCSGKKHDRASFQLAIPVSLCISVFSFYYSLGIQFVFTAIVAYILGAIFLNPDLDLFGSNPSKRWLFLKYLWIPYQKISGHRDHSFIKTVQRLSFSHFPIIGTISRLGYLFFLVYLVHLIYCRVYYLYPASFIELYTIVQPFQFPVFLGVELAAMIHLCYDFIYPLNRG